MSHEPDCSGCRNTPMEAACAIAFVYSFEEVEVEVLMVEVAVTESGVASFGGVGGKLNIGCEDEPEWWCSDLVTGSSEVPLNGEHQLPPKLFVCDNCLFSDELLSQDNDGGVKWGLHVTLEPATEKRDTRDYYNVNICTLNIPNFLETYSGFLFCTLRWTGSTVRSARFKRRPSDRATGPSVRAPASAYNLANNRKSRLSK